MLFIDSNTLHVPGVARPSSGVQEMFMQLMVQDHLHTHALSQKLKE